MPGADEAAHPAAVASDQPRLQRRPAVGIPPKGQAPGLQLGRGEAGEAMLSDRCVGRIGYRPLPERVQSDGLWREPDQETNTGPDPETDSKANTGPNQETDSKANSESYQDRYQGTNRRADPETKPRPHPGPDRSADTLPRRCPVRIPTPCVRLEVCARRSNRR